MAKEKPSRLSLLSLILWPLTMLWRLINAVGDWIARAYRGLTDVFTGGPVPNDSPKPQQNPAEKSAEKKRNNAWAFATVTGVLALLLLLAWQIHGLLTEEKAQGPADLRLADQAEKDDFASPLPPPTTPRAPDENDANGGGAFEPSANTNPPDFGGGEPKIVSNDNPGTQPDDPYGFGLPPEKKSSNGIPKSTDPPAFNLNKEDQSGDDSMKKSPFGTEPPPKEEPDPKTDDGNPIVEKKQPQLKFPTFGPKDDAGKEPAGNGEPPVKIVSSTDEKVEPPGKKSPELTFPGFEPQPKKDVAKPEPEKKENDQFPSFAPAKKGVVVSPPAKEKKQPTEFTPVNSEPKVTEVVREPPLSLEVVRNNPPSNEGGASFLVTSLLSQDETAVNPGGEAPEESLGWKAVRWDDDAGAILPVRYNVVAATGDGGRQLIRLGSTAALSLHVDELKRTQESPGRLTYQIVSLERGELGETVPLRLLVTNTGGTTLENVTVHVDLPDELKYHVGRKLEHTIRRLEPGRTHVARLTPTAVKVGAARITGKAIVAGKTFLAEQTVTIGTRTASRGPVTTSSNRSPGCCGSGVLR